MSAARASILIGADAQRWLNTPAQCERLTAAWAQSDAQCGFSHPVYLRTWFAHYATTFDPVLCQSDDDPSGAYIALALDRQTGTLTGAGGQHAEYHAAYCGHTMIPTTAALLVRSALEQTKAERLALRFLESRPQADALHAALARDMLTEHRVIPRPLRRLESADAERSVLRKSGTRSKLKRLERIAPVRFEAALRGDTVRETLAALVDWYDLRIGALGGGLPFREDPFRQPWLVDVMASSDSPFRASRLMLGDTPIAMHIGVQSGTRIALGVLAYDARYAAHSPAKLLLHSLFADSVERGVSEFDLTPFGTYKDRYANTHDDVSILNAKPSPPRRVRTRVAVQRRVRDALKTVPAIENALRTMVHTAQDYGYGGAVEQARRWVRADHAVHVFHRAPRTPTAPSSRTPETLDVVRDWLSRRLPAVAVREDQPSYRRLLGLLEQSEHVVGVSRGSQIAAWGFLSRPASLSEWAWKALPDALTTTMASSWVMHDLWFDPSAADIPEPLIHALCARAAEDPGESPPIVLILSDAQRALRRAVELQGFTLLGTALRRTRRGVAHITWRTAARD